MASTVVRWFLLILFRVNCLDANMPYRLMNGGAWPISGPYLENFLLANIALTVLLKQSKEVSHGYIPIHFRDRYGGEPSVDLENSVLEGLKCTGSSAFCLRWKGPSKPSVP